MAPMALAGAGAATSPALVLNGLTVADGQSVILSRISFALPRNCLAACVGPPGAGKSALLLCLAGRLQARGGEIVRFGEAGAEARGSTAYVGQHDSPNWQFPLTVSELVSLGRFSRGGLLSRTSARDRFAVRAALETAEISGLSDTPIGALSAMQRMRALLARAFAREPRALLLDEPLVGLTDAQQSELLALLGRWLSLDRFVLLATRQLDGLAERYGYLVLVAGALVAAGPPETVLTSAHLETAYRGHEVLTLVPPGKFALDG